MCQSRRASGGVSVAACQWRCGCWHVPPIVPGAPRPAGNLAGSRLANRVNRATKRLWLEARPLVRRPERRAASRRPGKARPLFVPVVTAVIWIAAAAGSGGADSGRALKSSHHPGPAPLDATPTWWDHSSKRSTNQLHSKSTKVIKSIGQGSPARSRGH